MSMQPYTGRVAPECGTRFALRHVLEEAQFAPSGGRWVVRLSRRVPMRRPGEGRLGTVALSRHPTVRQLASYYALRCRRLHLRGWRAWGLAVEIKFS